MAYPAVFKKAEVGHAREEYYTRSKAEEFGLNKRTRRLARGDKNVTTPDGKSVIGEHKDKADF